MKPQCPGCRAGSASIVRNGRYFRRDDSRYIQRFKCLACAKHFSSATFSDTYRQKKRRINQPLYHEFCCSTSMRRIAQKYRLSRSTVARRLTFLAQRARQQHTHFLAQYTEAHGPIEAVQFDDLHSFEHSKCKPNQVHVMVATASRCIIGVGVSQIPASGHLAAISRRKYGFRADHGQRGRHRLFRAAKPWLSPTVCLQSDEHPQYPPLIRQHFKHGKHLRHKGIKGCVTGQGELKKTHFDPLFAINHTLAMLRDNIKRLTRRTWCTTKVNERLADHVAIYVQYHNQVLLDLRPSALLST